MQFRKQHARSFTHGSLFEFEMCLVTKDVTLVRSFLENKKSVLKLKAGENNNDAQNLSFRGTPRLLIARSDLLRSGRSGNRVPMGARFSAPVQNGPRAHTASYKMGTVSFLGLKLPGRGVYHPPLSSAEDKEKIDLYLYISSRHSWAVLG
jgi:hypothetical protein